MHQGIIIYIMNILKYYKIYLKHKFHISFYLKIFQSIKNNLILTGKIIKLHSRILHSKFNSTLSISVLQK